ncbi:acyltransferase family protein [Paenibacillus sp. NPDC056579]|uniref:acyltransferase family protein n=1 Tax=Paenibacillus sp. NPDC056579 TaxID=3345871 RepID=UPI00369C39B8
MLHSLTSFRFVAAMMVFLYHVNLFKQFELGTAGVQFFFVLSGFILAYNYRSKFSQLTLNQTKKFYLARFAKIYPVHVLTFVISIPLVVMYFHPNGLYAVKFAVMSAINLMLIHSFIPSQATYFNFNGVSWTLSVESVFYLTFPFIIWLFTKFRVTRNVLKSLIVLFAAWLIMFLLNMNLDADNNLWVWMLHIFPITRLFEFMTGVLLGIIFIEQSTNKLKFVNNTKLFHWLELLSLLSFVISLVLSKQMSPAIVRGVYFVPVWCFLIYVFAFQKGVLSKALSNKWLVYLGEISFSFYMIHQLVIRYSEFTGIAPVSRYVLCFIVSLVLSALMFQYYEEPLRKKIRFGLFKTSKPSVQLSNSAMIK